MKSHTKPPAYVHEYLTGRKDTHAIAPYRLKSHRVQNENVSLHGSLFHYKFYVDVRIKMYNVCARNSRIIRI